MLTQSKLNLLCWEGYDNETFNAGFTTANNAEINAQTLLSDFDTANQLLINGVGNCDLLNINNAYVKHYLHPNELIKKLDSSRFSPYLENLLPVFDRFKKWARDGNDIIGVCQRFGAFNLVVNSRRIDIHSAEEQGFSLANDLNNRNRFGILSYEDFNLFHLCIGSDINPFDSLNDQQEKKVIDTAIRWCESAAIISNNHHRLNRALVDGDIDFYISGGVYTASPARRDGHTNIRAITPKRGPIDGHGGIAFCEITSALNRANSNPLAESYLEFVVQPDQAAAIAFSKATCNPIAQMGSPHVLKKFSQEQLDIIQWDSLEEDLSRCADYNLMPNHDSLLAGWRSVLAKYTHKTIY